jgi:hypothetical protein
MFTFNLKPSRSAFECWYAFYIWVIGSRKGELFQATEKGELKIWDTITNRKLNKFADFVNETRRMKHFGNGPSKPSNYTAFYPL